MKTKLILLITAIVLLSSPAMAQNFDLPLKIKFSVATNEQFYPLGWSKDGKFAYLGYKWVDYPLDAPLYVLKIMSLKTDKLLYSKKFVPISAEPRENAIEWLAIWNKNQQMIKENLINHNIVFSDKNNIAKASFDFKGSGYKIIKSIQKNAKIFRSPTGEKISKQIIRSYQLKLQSEKLGSKILSSYKTKKNEEQLTNMRIIGVLKPAFTDRAVVFIEQTVLDGLSGLEEVKYIKLIGAHLTKGFKATNNGPSSVITNPATVNMMAFSKKPSSSMYAIDTIIPIGWSRDGKFAYITANEVEGRGGHIFQFIIINTKNDKTIWKHEDDNENGMEINKTTISQSIQKNAKVLSHNLEKHNIIQDKGTTLFRFPYTSGNKKYEASINTVYKPQRKDQYGIGSIDSMKVLVTQNSNKNKIIFYTNKTDAFSYWIAGYFKNPYDKQILVAIGQEDFVFEGTEGSFNFSGCSLDSGFK